MKQQKTVESRVLEILKECPMSRYDDMLLILHYYNRYGYIPAGNLPFEDIVFNYRAYGLPCFETIRRARQRVLMERLVYKNYGNKAKNFIFTKDFTGKN